MRSRSVIVFLLTIFLLISGYNFYYTVKRLQIDRHLSSLTPEERLKWLQDKENYEAYKTAVKNSISLGLDLQGGMFITMELGMDEVIKNLAANPNDKKLLKAIELANKKRVASQENYVDLFVESFKEIDPNVKLAPYFAGDKTGLSFTASNDEVITRLKEETESALDRTFNVLRVRIDQFGVASPNLQKQSGTGRILIELPGVRDAKRVRRILRTTARLEFWPTYPVKDAFNYLVKVNEKLKVLEGVVKDTTVTNADSLRTEGANVPADSVQAQAKEDTAASQAQADTSLGGVSDILGTEQQVQTQSEDTTGMTQEERQAKFDRENPLFAYLRPPDLQNMPVEVANSSPVVGYALISDTAKVNEYLRRPEIQALLPTDLRFAWTVKPEQEGSMYLTLIALKTNREGKAPITGEYIVDARADFDQQTNQPIVEMRMNPEGARIWRKLTKKYLKKAIAIVLDNNVYSYPIVQSEIPNGVSQISGNFTVEEAKDLANVLKAGKLPVTAKIVGEEIVGPTLGEDTIKRGTIAFILAFLSILLFMPLYYKSAGIIADLALVANLYMIIGIASAFNVVLTFPGIAGIILTMGMAVDANVLIYERIREELFAGRSLKASIADGFKNALSAILDGNITTFLTGLILFFFGTGPIRGFAVMLMIGIITTLVSALVITRVLIDYWVNVKRKTISFGSEKIIEFFRKLQYPFIPKRKTSYIVVGALAVIFIAVISVFGFKLSVDFTGGRQYIVEVKEGVNVNIETLRKDLTAAFDNHAPVIKSIGAKNQYMVTTHYLYGADAPENADEIVKEKLLEGFKKSYKDLNPQIVKSTVVGPTIAEDIKRGAIYSVLFSLLVIFAYIFMRFRKWQFGIGALASLTFNVIFVLGIFSLLGQIENLPFSVALDQAFIAAILTIVGYTINDGVIVFDRIREIMNNTKFANVSLEEIFNKGINETLARTVITSLTTLLTAIILFVFGGDVLRGFLLALIVGVTVGTLSSIFVASPVALDLILMNSRKVKDENKGSKKVTSSRKTKKQKV